MDRQMDMSPLLLFLQRTLMQNAKHNLQTGLTASGRVGRVSREGQGTSEQAQDHGYSAKLLFKQYCTTHSPWYV